MKVLVLFDVARPADPNEAFSPESLKQEDKPTEADVLESSAPANNFPLNEAGERHILIAGGKIGRASCRERV